MHLFSALAQRYSEEHQSADGAQRLAQEIAFVSIVFQVSRLMMKFGILDLLNDHSDSLTQAEITEKAQTSGYATQVLLEASPSIGTVHTRDNRYFISKAGWFLLKDKMAHVNIGFAQEICYQDMFDLEKTLQMGKSEGLKVFGSWPTIHEGPPSLPSVAQREWSTFDHYYSDNSSAEALKTTFARPAKKLLDVGGNTGRQAEQCVGYDVEVEITIMDSPQQVVLMCRATRGKAGAGRIHARPANLLGPEVPFPTGFDAIWMSQFLDCFSEEQIASILRRAAASMDAHTSLYIMEPCWDRQQYETAAYYLTMTSLYFTTMTNGNSKIFHSEDLIRCAKNTRLKMMETSDGIRRGHSILHCERVI